MINAERQEKIKDYIYANKYANINDLAELLHTSTATIRRCLKQLEAENVVQLVRNGAAMVSDGTTFEQPYLIKRKQNSEEKSRIAQAATKLLSTNDNIFMDSSSTVYEMSHFLKEAGGLMVSTNDVLISGALTGLPDVTVMVIGGIQRKGFYTLTGSFAENSLGLIHVDYAFVGVDSISPDGNFMITNSDEVGVKQAIFRCANKRIVLCDHSKFGHTAFIKLWDTKDIDMVITGRELDDKTYENYRELELNIMRV